MRDHLATTRNFVDAHAFVQVAFGRQRAESRRRRVRLPGSPFEGAPSPRRQAGRAARPLQLPLSLRACSIAVCGAGTQERTARVLQTGSSLFGSWGLGRLASARSQSASSRVTTNGKRAVWPSTASRSASSRHRGSCERVLLRRRRSQRAGCFSSSRSLEAPSPPDRRPPPRKAPYGAWDEPARPGLKTIGVMRKTRHRGKMRVGWMFTFTAAAYNLVRMRNLAAAVI